ncbi:MAG: hypothetical protein JO007_10580 [Alphaproteobacteria bacterium]|nr:hypothetical protein [Alphaproteobacteria bacterium]
MNSIDHLTGDDFNAYLGRVFRPATSNLGLVLVQIDRHEFTGWNEAPRKPFSLILRGPPRPILLEGSYRIAIENGPVMTLYTIPIFTAARDHQNYQIVFN